MSGMSEVTAQRGKHDEPKKPNDPINDGQGGGPPPPPADPGKHGKK